MQRLIIDKIKTPEVADWAADKEPGDRVCIYGTIHSQDEQSLTITMEEVGDDKSKDDEEGGNEGSDAAPDAAPGTMLDQEDAGAPPV